MTCQLINQDSPIAGADELGEVLQQYMEVTGRLQRTHETLQREVVRLHDELASKNRELEVRRRLAALGELAAGVAHEVRNPLGAIQLYSGLLRNECQCLEPALKLIEKIEVGIRAIDGVVQDTLALARRPGELAPRCLRTIIDGARDVCRQTLQTHRVRLKVDLADPAVCVFVEADGLQRVLVNLIVNAAEASPPRGTIRVLVGPTEGRADDRPLTQSVKGPPEVVLRVLDQGSGLSEEVLERLFDPFFTTKRHGTGLGLTIAHRLVEAYGGRLTAGNRAEGGAEMTVVLPAAEGLPDG